jgi:predicted MFS family arabinose efflux permease
VTEIVSWGTLYYALPVMLPWLSRDTGWTSGAALSAFSTGSLVSALAAVPVGRIVERYGPRIVMTVGSLLGTSALLTLARAPSLSWFFAAWVIAGLAQAGLLYPPAFAALTRWYGSERLRAITTLSLVAGFASTLFAPLTGALDRSLGWRGTYTVYAVVLAAVTLPLHSLGLRLRWDGELATRATGTAPPPLRTVILTRPYLQLVAALAVASFGIYGATVDVVPLLASRGLGDTVAGSAIAVVGAAQLLGRLAYPRLSRHTRPSTRTLCVLAASALSIGALSTVAGSAALLAVAAAGAARGAYTLLQATAVSDRWGVIGYASLNGIALAPTGAAVALAPAGTALLAEHLGGYPHAFVLLAVLTVAAAFISIGSSPSATPRGRGAR